MYCPSGFLKFLNVAGHPVRNLPLWDCVGVNKRAVASRARRFDVAMDAGRAHPATLARAGEKDNTAILRVRTSKATLFGRIT
jgi:hypothetical protein